LQPNLFMKPALDSSRASLAQNDTPDPASQFYSGAYARILGSILLLGFVGSGVFWARFGRRFGLGFLIGAAIALLNFHWLKRIVGGLADGAARAGSKAPASGLVLRFLLRYGLIAAAAYVIVKSSSVNIYGLLAGLFLPVAAIFIEAGYELYVALRRGF